MSAARKVQPDRNDPEMYEVAGPYLVAGNLPIEDAREIAALPAVMEALRSCQAALKMMTNADSIRETTVLCAWTCAVRAEAKARSAIALATGAQA
jgi:hypothetical protein